MKTGVMVAARMGSTRLPGKALLPLVDRPVLGLVLERLLPSKKADLVVLATTTLPEDDALANLAGLYDVPVFRGSQDDLVDRFVGAATQYDLDYVVRVTGDCPFVDADTLDFCLTQCASLQPFDLATTKGSFPVGLDFEVYAAPVMQALHEGDVLSFEDREHLTLYMYNHAEEFNICKLSPPAYLQQVKEAFTLDTQADYQKMQDWLKDQKDPQFSVQAILEQNAS